MKLSWKMKYLSVSRCLEPGAGLSKIIIRNTIG